MHLVDGGWSKRPDLGFRGRPAHVCLASPAAWHGFGPLDSLLVLPPSVSRFLPFHPLGCPVAPSTLCVLLILLSHSTKTKIKNFPLNGFGAWLPPTSTRGSWSESGSGVGKLPRGPPWGSQGAGMEEGPLDRQPKESWMLRACPSPSVVPQPCLPLPLLLTCNHS